MRRTTRYAAKTLKGLEKVLAQELRALGADQVTEGRRVVFFEGNKEVLYRANLNVRTAINILKPIEHFRFSSESDLYEQFKKIVWGKHQDVEQTFAIRASVFSEAFNHTKFPALKLKDTLADWFRDKYGRRPSVDLEKPNIGYDLHISKDRATISMDSSGSLLNRRGYRIDGGQAPLNEVLAAGLISLSGWNKKEAFHNPMCGSGTLAIEAAMMAANIPPNYKRKSFGFHNWPDYDNNLWLQVYGDAMAAVADFTEVTICANDLSPRALRMTQQNATAAGVDELIDFGSGDFADFSPEEGSGIVMINPPYGERLEVDEIESLYSRMGDHLKKAYTGFDAWLITSNQDALRAVGLASSQKITIFNGKLETRFVKFGLYKGSKRNT